METDDLLSDDEGTSTHTDGYCHYNDSKDKTFQIELLDHHIELIQKPAATDLGIGAVVWDSSVIFSKYVENCRNNRFSTTKIAGKTVLELGSGCGLGGLSLLLRGAIVTFTDLPEVMSQLTTINMHKTFKRLQSSGSHHTFELHEPKFQNLDWTELSAAYKDIAVVDESLKSVDGTVDSRETFDASRDIFSHLFESLDSTYDIVLCTDCVFSMAVSLDLIQTINIFSNPKTIVICCYETRDEATNSFFLDEFGKSFAYKVIPKKDLHPDFQSPYVSIINCSRKRIATKS